MISLRKNIFIAGVLLVLPFLGFGQIDTTKVDSNTVYLDHIKHQDISEIYISIPTLAYKKLRPIEFEIGKKDIEELATDDAGDLISKLPGVNVKSYGGLGGLKTVSYHSMGSGHTSIVLDGVMLNNSQSGQVNLGQIQSDGVSSVNLNSVSQGSLFLPVSAQITGNIISLNSFRRYYDRKSSLRATVKYGSFNRQDAYVSGSKLKGKNWLFSAFGSLRQADGNYNYTFLNGLTEFEGARKNNDYRDLYFGAQVQYKTKEGRRLYVGYKGSIIQQGLPGAVILYNETADERLKTNDHLFYGRGYWVYKKVDFNLYGNVNQNNLNYIDPTYLNAAGNINIDYLNRNAVLGLKFQRQQFQSYVFGGGIEQTVSNLVSSDSSLSNPIRFHSKALTSFVKNSPIGDFTLMVSGQYVYENTNLGSSSREMFKVNPFFSYQSREVRNFQYQHTGTYKNSFRMPSFNELYYNSVGNSSLLPETAHQFIYMLRMIPVESIKKDLVIRTSLYYNRVNNKIVAIPTKNLFVWSMQNVTNVNVFGGDVSAEFEWKLKKSNYKMTANYTYQKAIDITEGSLNFGDQIAYTPEHMANFDVGMTIKNFGCRLSNNFTGGRYALNENTEANLVQGYLISDIAVHYTFQLKKQNELKIQANVKNVFNQSYAYVRSFVMPGRNYLISLSYALN